MKHTPGPWTAFIGGRGRTISIDIGPTPNGKRPCIINWSGFDDTDLPVMQRVANAHLIAAAPDLLGALKGLLMWMTFCPTHALIIAGGKEAYEASIKAASAAIAKAERGSK
jgi:hypothetical protein